MRIIKENIRLKDGEIIELIKMSELEWEEKKAHAKTLLNVSKAAGQDPKEYVYEWLRSADLFLLANSKKLNSIIGFSLSHSYENDNIIYIAATMVIPQYQKKDVATKFVKKIVKTFFLKKIKYRLEDIFLPFYLLFRTQNPSIYFDFQKYNLTLYPSFDQNVKIPKEIISIASKYAKILWPYASFDKETFVLKNAYKFHPDLALEPNHIHWSKNELINQEFKKRLNLDKKSYDALVIFVKINFFSAFKAFF